MSDSPTPQLPSLTIGNIVSPDGGSTVADEATAAGLANLDHQRKQVEIHGAQQDITERKKYASKVYWLIVGWLIMLFVVLFFQGFKPHGFALSDPVLLALIGGTTVNVLGIFIVVVNYLFAKK